MRATYWASLTNNRNILEAEHENEPERGRVGRGRGRAAGVPHDGEDAATPPRGAIHCVYPERRARAGDPLWVFRERDPAQQSIRLGLARVSTVSESGSLVSSP